MRYLKNREILIDGLATMIGETKEGHMMQALVKHFTTIQALVTAEEEDFLEVPGIGVKKACRLVTALSFLQMSPHITEKSFTIRCPEDVFEYVIDLQYEQQEQFVCLGLNTKNQVMFRETIFVGSLNSSIVHPRETFSPLIKKKCASAVVVHNYPSGNPTPSQEDIEVTKRLSEVGRLVGIELLDHIVIGRSNYASLKEEGGM